jgi:hypothetical protein
MSTVVFVLTSNCPCATIVGPIAQAEQHKEFNMGRISDALTPETEAVPTAETTPAVTADVPKVDEAKTVDPADDGGAFSG